MFVQVIEGSTKDPDALHRQMEIWERDLLPGAVGYLGSSGGCTDSGECILLARFEDTESARRSSERPEQSRWWADTEKCFDGPVRFHDSQDVQVMRHGQLNSAGFLQVMEGHVSDRDRAVNLERRSDPVLAEARPDLLGAITTYFPGGEFTEVAYFTTESAAREAESHEPEGGSEVGEMMAEWQEVMRVDKFLDIREPWLLTR